MLIQYGVNRNEKVKAMQQQRIQDEVKNLTFKP